MSQTVMTYHYVAELKLVLRFKVEESNSTFEQLLMRVRLEEAKLHDLQPDSLAKQTTESNQKRRPIQATPRGATYCKCYICR